MNRTDAVEAFAVAAASLTDIRRKPRVDPVELVVAESRLETARKRFWAADAEYGDLLSRVAQTA